MNLNINLIKYIFSILFFLQIIRLLYIKFFYAEISREYSCNKIVNIESVKLRSKIADTFGDLLAENKEVLSACFSPSHNLSKNFLDFINEKYNITYDDILNKHAKHFCFIKRRLTKDEELEINSFNFKEIFFIKEFERIYPNKFLSPIIGCVDTESNGISGLELYLDEVYPGLCSSNSDNYMDVFETNIDIGLSYRIYRIIKDSCWSNQAEFATAVVMNPSDGSILSMVQCPVSTFQESNSNLIKYSKPLSITEAYEMGSVVKAFCMLAALDEKVVTPDEIIDCRNTNHTKIRGFDVNTWKSNGEITFKDVIKGSNNIGIVQVAMRLDKKLYDHYRKIGFGDKTGIELPGEACGFITPPNKWSSQTILSLSYGYEVSSSLLQLVRAWSMFTNKGKIISPRLLKITSKYETSEVYSNEAIDQARDILKYQEDRIPRKYRSSFENVDLYGKTGTANVLENGVYQKDKNTFCFVGHIESGDWKRIVGVFINQSKAKNAYANTIAYPIFLKIANEILIRRYIS
jgi:cell division protein FtsI (penicillin-binding protein 3)